MMNNDASSIDNNNRMPKVISRIKLIWRKIVRIIFVFQQQIVNDTRDETNGKKPETLAFNVLSFDQTVNMQVNVIISSCKWRCEIMFVIYNTYWSFLKYSQRTMRRKTRRWFFWKSFFREPSGKHLEIFARCENSYMVFFLNFQKSNERLYPISNTKINGTA